MKEKLRKVGPPKRVVAAHPGGSLGTNTSFANPSRKRRRRSIPRLSQTDRSVLERELDESHRKLIRLLFDDKCCFPNCPNKDAEVAHTIPKSINPHQRWAMYHVLMCRQHHDAYDGRMGVEAQDRIKDTFRHHYPLHWKWISDHLAKRENPWTMTQLRSLLVEIKKDIERTGTCLYVSRLGGRR